MATALLHRSQPPWRNWIALAAAVLVHVGALRLAARLTTTAPSFPQMVWKTQDLSRREG